MNKQILTNLQKFFLIGWKKSAERPEDQIFPLKPVKDDKGYTHFDKEKFPDEVKKLFAWWLSDTHSREEDWKNRTQLFQDMDMVYYNCAMLAKAMEIMADEVVQADMNMQPVFIEAKRPVKKFILDFFDKVNVYSLIRPTVLDLIRYGNSGWMLGFDDSGISEIIPVNMYSLKDRLEFSPDEVDQRMKGDDLLFSQFRTHERINQLIQSITDKDDITAVHKNYLFGFQINDQIVPPWRFIHFRNFTFSSPFKPFGVPIFVHSIAPYRQWDAAMTMQIVARGSMFPKEIYKLKISNVVDPSTKLQLATDFLNELLNSGIGTTKKELPGVNEIRISIDDLFEWNQEVPQVNLGKIDDIQMLLDEVANSTFLPRNLIDPRDAGFGDSGVSLIEKFKPFARLVFRLQSTFLANLTQVIKIHMIYSGEFAMEDMDFVLSMPYPESQINTEIISSQTSQWDLANNVINSLSDKLLGGESLPTDVIRQVYQKILPYDDETIENFINGALKARKENDVKEYENEIKALNEPEETKEKAPEQVQSDNEQKAIDNENLNLDRQKIDVEKEKLEIQKQKNQKAKQDLEKESVKFRKWRLKEEFKALKKWKKLEEKEGKVKLQEMIDDEIFQEKQDNLKDGIHRKKHYFSSRNVYTEFPAELIHKLEKDAKVEKARKLQEEEFESEEKQKEYEKKFLKEEIKYDFAFEKQKAEEENNKKNTQDS